MKVFKGIPKKRIFLDGLFTIIWSLFNASFSKMLADTVAGLTDMSTVSKTALFFLVYIILWELIEFVSDIFSTCTGAVIEANVNKYYFNEMYKIRPSVLKESNTGYISGVLHKLVLRQEQCYRDLVIHVPLCIVYIIYFTVQMWTYHWSLGLLLLGSTIAGNIIRLVVGEFAKKISAELSDAEGLRNKVILDFTGNINTVQKMKSINFMNCKIDEHNSKCLVKTRKWSIFEEIAFCTCKMSIFMYTPLALYISSKVSMNGDVSSFYNMLTVVSIQLVHNSKSIVSAIVHYSKFAGNYEKLQKIIDSSNRRKEVCTELFESAVITDLVYSYKYNKNNESAGKQITVSIPNFKVESGDKVCIYGESGQGKTTLLHLLSGEIENNNTLINNKYKDKILDCVFVAQDTEMFDMSLRDNLKLGRDIDDCKLLEYITAVGMKDWFDRQTEGLDTMLGERGVFVSTGQRQRLNLIRGLLMDNKEIYLLDEPTSNVDEDVEISMVKLISTVLKDKTVVVVTHRPRIKDICNKIYKFENGVVTLESNVD